MSIEIDLVVHVDIDAELGTHAYWQVSLNDVRTGGEGIHRQPVPAPPCYVPVLIWYNSRRFRSDRLLVFRDDTEVGYADYREGVVDLYPGEVRARNLRLIAAL